MELEFEEDEIWGVIQNFKGDKALGPDGFTMAFFQNGWEILKTDIIAVLKEFQTSVKFEKSLNATFVSLIPKKAGAVDIKDFQPISLIGGIYKIISKVHKHPQNPNQNLLTHSGMHMLPHTSPHTLQSSRLLFYPTLARCLPKPL